MFTQLGSSAAEHSSGFAIKRIGREELQYVEGDHIMVVDVEAGWASQDDYFLTIYERSIDSWLPPHEQEIISPEKKQQIIKSIRDAQAFLGVKTTVE